MVPDCLDALLKKVFPVSPPFGELILKDKLYTYVSYFNTADKHACFSGGESKIALQILRLDIAVHYG